MGKAKAVSMADRQIHENATSFVVEGDSKKLGTMIVTRVGVEWHSAKTRAKMTQVPWKDLLAFLKEGKKLRLSSSGTKEVNRSKVATPIEPGKQINSEKSKTTGSVKPVKSLGVATTSNAKVPKKSAEGNMKRQSQSAKK